MEMEQQKGKDSEMAGSAPGTALGMVMFIIDNGVLDAQRLCCSFQPIILGGEVTISLI